MSRSRRKRPFIGLCCAESEKPDKRLAHGAERCHARTRLSQAGLDEDPDSIVFPTRREVSDVWEMAKDTKLRFDPKVHPKLMRK